MQKYLLNRIWVLCCYEIYILVSILDDFQLFNRKHLTIKKENMDDDLIKNHLMKSYILLTYEFKSYKFVRNYDIHVKVKWSCKIKSTFIIIDIYHILFTRR